MKKELFKLTSISGSFVLFLLACNGNNTKTFIDDRGKDTSKVNTQAATPTKAEVDPLPNLLEIGATIKNSGLKYIPGLTKSNCDASQYNTAFEKQINLGIYFADLSYCTLNKQNDQSAKYLKAVKILSDDIGIGQLFGSNTFYQRYQSNLNNSDSLTAIVADLQDKADNLTKANLQNYMRVIIYSGAWIENVYIGAKVSSQSKNNSTGLQIIEQMTMLDNILKVMEKYKGIGPDMDSLNTGLKQIADKYHSFDEVKNYNPDAAKQFSLTEEHNKNLIELLYTIHSKFIK